MATLAEYIAKNMVVVRTLVKAGKLSPTCINDYQLYTFYNSLKHMNSKMDRYQFTADSNKVGIDTVRKAVRSMNSKV